MIYKNDFEIYQIRTSGPDSIKLTFNDVKSSEFYSICNTGRAEPTASLYTFSK